MSSRERGREAGLDGSAQPPDERISSWKGIARHLGVSVRSVQRWEQSEALPVRRHMHAVLGSVYCLRKELDAWWASRPDLCGAGALLRRGRRTIAVLPFANLDGDLETEVLADGLTDEVIDTLAQVPGLRVIARTSVFYFKNSDADGREVGAKLGADTILEGSVRCGEGRVRVTAFLTDAASGDHLWSEVLESRREDVFGLQQDIAHAVAGTLRVIVGIGIEHARLPAPTRVAGAYERYLEGLFYWNKRTPAGFLKAVECLERVVAEDPRMAPAWALLASCYGNTVASTLLPRESQEKAMRAARTALDLDPGLAEAHVSLGALAAIHQLDWEGAESHFRRAIELKPQLAEAHLLYGGLALAPMGRLAEAYEQHQLTLRLDPMSALAANGGGMMHLALRQYGQAAAGFEAALRLDPVFPWANRGLGEVRLLQRRYREAIESLRKVEMPGLVAGFLGWCYANLGREDEARNTLRSLEQSGVPSVAYQAAIVHLALGDLDATFGCLHRACEERSVGFIWMPVDPIWEPVRSDARFAGVVASMGLDFAAVTRALEQRLVAPSRVAHRDVQV